MKKLKPCPFCGCKNIRTWIDGRYYPKHELYFVECDNDECKCRTDVFENKDEAIKVWNRRVRYGKEKILFN